MQVDANAGAGSETKLGDRRQWNMKGMPSVMAALAIFTISGCATEPQPNTTTRSAIVHFHRLPPDSAPLVFGSACSNAGGRVVQSTSGLFQCSFPMGSTFRETTYQVMVNGGVTRPEKQLEFLYAASGDGIDVTAITWVERQGAYGPQRDDVNFVGNLTQLLEAMAKSFEEANPQ